VYGENRTVASQSSECEGERLRHVGRGCSTTESCGGKRDTDEFGASFAVFKTVGYDSKSQCLNLRLRLRRRVPITV